MKKGIRISFQVLSILLFVVLLWWAGLDPWKKIVHGDLQAILWGFLFLSAATVISAIRLRSVTRAMSDEILPSLVTFYYINIIARALGIFLPRSLSGIGGKAVGLKTMGFSLSRAIWIVMVDNIFDILVLVAMALPSFLFITETLNLIGFACLLIFVLILLAGLLWWGTEGDRVKGIIHGLKRIPWISGKLQDVEITDGFLMPPPMASLAILGWSLLLNGAMTISYYYIGQAVALNADWLTYVVAYPFAQLSLIIAIAPGGLGIFDLGWLGLLQLSGVSETDTLDFIVAQRAYTTIFVIILTAVGFALSLTQNSRHNITPQNSLDSDASEN